MKIITRLTQKKLNMISPIKSEEQYENYLGRAYDLMQQEILPNTLESDELELLSILIEDYEKKHYPIDAPNPIDAIVFRLDQLNLKRSALNEILGSRSRASEIISGKRKLTLSMIRMLNQKLDIPAEVLIKDYELDHAR